MINQRGKPVRTSIAMIVALPVALEMFGKVGYFRPDRFADRAQSLTVLECTKQAGDMAQGGGPDTPSLDEVLKQLPEWLRNQLQM